MYADGNDNANAHGRVNAQADAYVAGACARLCGAIRCYIINLLCLVMFCAWIRLTT